MRDRGFRGNRTVLLVLLLFIFLLLSSLNLNSEKIIIISFSDNNIILYVSLKSHGLNNTMT